MNMHARGFTLVEMIIVIVVTSVIAATLAVFGKPAADAYVGSKVRAELTDQADTALRRLLRDVRQAVPNSIRIPSSQCFEVIPTSTGGRFRKAPDTVNDASCSGAACTASLDPSQATTQFDTLTDMQPVPAVNDWIVVNNQNGNDVYNLVNATQITGISTRTAGATQGRHRITIGSKQFSYGYDGGRFVVVPNSQRAVFYVCSGAGVDGSGNGTGTLYRKQNYGFNGAYPTACPDVSGADVVATRIKSCNFVYDPNQGATQQSGFLWAQIEISRSGEAAMLAQGAHVSNAP